LVTNTTVTSNGLKEPVTDRALISNGFYEPITDRFNFCNGLALMFVTKNSRSPLPEVHIGNGHCEGKPQGRPATLMQTTTVTDVGVCNWC
jgi:hypothetical protein